MDMAMARQVASLLAALMILLAYGGQQMGWMDSRLLLQHPQCDRLPDSRIRGPASFPDWVWATGGSLGADQSVGALATEESCCTMMVDR
jgi:hypothetical protein